MDGKLRLLGLYAATIPAKDPWKNARATGVGWFATYDSDTGNEKTYLDLPIWVPNGLFLGCQLTIP